MNTNYDRDSVIKAEIKGLGRLQDAQCERERIPMLPLLLNDLSRATEDTAELVEQLEKQLDSITAPELSVPSPVNQKDPSCLPPALEMLRTTLSRVNAVNAKLNGLRRRVEI